MNNNEYPIQIHSKHPPDILRKYLWELQKNGAREMGLTITSVGGQRFIFKKVSQSWWRRNDSYGYIEIILEPHPPNGTMICGHKLQHFGFRTLYGYAIIALAFIMALCTGDLTFIAWVLFIMAIAFVIYIGVVAEDHQDIIKALKKYLAKL